MRIKKCFHSFDNHCRALLQSGATDKLAKEGDKGMEWQQKSKIKEVIVVSGR